MRKLILMFLISCLMVMGQGSNNPLTITSGPPASVGAISLQVVGNPGSNSYYYWVVPNFPIGQGGISQTNGIISVPNLSGSQYVKVIWNLVNGASSYDVLRTLTPAVPSPCTCSIATGVTGNSYNDTGGGLGSYTYSPVGSYTAHIILDNQNYYIPRLTFDTATNSTLYANLPSASSSNGLIYLIKDASSSSTCNLGGGTNTPALCWSNGSIWIAVGGSGGGSGVTIETNGVNNASQTVLNFQNSSVFNGLTFTFTNISGGNVQGGFTGTIDNSGLTNSAVTINTTGPLAGGGSVSLGSSITLTCTTCNTSSASVTSVRMTTPSWLTVSGSPITTSGTLAVAPTTAQTSHQVIGTCNTATTFAPCSLVAGDLPTTGFTTQSLGNNTTAIATDQFVNNQLCSIAEFNPAANGTTDDSAVFTTAQATCGGIMLTPGKQYAIGTNLILTSAINTVGNLSLPPFVIKTGITLTLNGTITAPLQTLFTFQGTGVAVIGPKTLNVPVEWFGAVGDGSTDDTTAINATIISVGTAGGGNVQFRGTTYKTTAAVTVGYSYVNLIGEGFSSLLNGGTTIKTTSTTADILAVVGTGANCAAGAIYWSTVSNMSLTRATASSSSGRGLNLTDTCWVTVNNIQSTDSISNFYIHGSSDTLLRHSQASWSGSSATARYGYDIDSTSSTPNASTRFENNVADGTSGTNVTGFYLHGDCVGDFFSILDQSANAKVGMNITSTNHTSTTCNTDIHLLQEIQDGFTSVGYSINGVNTATTAGNVEPSVEIGSAHLVGSSATTCVDIESSEGVLFHDNFDIRGCSTGVLNNASNYGHYNSIVNNKFANISSPISLTGAGSGLSVIEGNVILNNSATITTAINLGNGIGGGNVITGNLIYSPVGTSTNGILVGTGTDHNYLWPNGIYGYTNKILNNGPTSNILGPLVSFSFEPGLQTSVVAGDFGFSLVQNDAIVDNIIASAQQFTCSVNPTITFYDCGTSTTCAGPTTIGTVTLTTAVTAVSGTVSNSAITAGDYIAASITAGTCTVLDISGKLQAHVK